MLSLKDISVTPPSEYSGSFKSFIFYFYLVWRGKCVGRVLLNDPGEFGTTGTNIGLQLSTFNQSYYSKQNRSLSNKTVCS